MSSADLIFKLFLQLIIILFTCRIVSYLGVRFFHQTSVVCEMVAGVLLGPSFLGLLFPTFQSWLFPITPCVLNTGQTIPNPSMSILFSISQIGLVLFMFIVGIEFDTNLIKKYFKKAGFVSATGIIVPFTLGYLISVYFADQYDFFNPNLPAYIKHIYFGSALSITAFPMMARILQENHLIKTKFGTLALAAGSMDDVCAWILLAVILASIKNDLKIFLTAIVGIIIYLIVMFLIKKLIIQFRRNKDLMKKIRHIKGITIMLIMLMISAWFTDVIGIYTVFGAFVAGVIIPRGQVADQIKKDLYKLTVAFLLPTFFVYSGLNTQLTLINSTGLILITLLILGAAIFGKGVACTLAARLSGESWPHAMMIGNLMNARGLMELIILNIGLQENIITSTMYSILILMAIITTLMTSPIYFYLKKNKIITI